MKPDEYKKYLLEYYHNGAWWNITIPALSEEDAWERISQLQFARLLGTVEMELPVKYGFFARALCRLQNLRLQ